MKNSFIMYLDSLDVLDELTDDQAGKLFKAIRKIQKGEPNPELDFGLKMALLPFKIQFERDNKKYNAICERNRNNGKKGGRPGNPKNPENQWVIWKPKKPRQTQWVIWKPKKPRQTQTNPKKPIVIVIVIVKRKRRRKKNI
jgi:hypothetical protein